MPCWTRPPTPLTPADKFPVGAPLNHLVGEWSRTRVVDAWPPGGSLHHCHQRRFGAAEFNGTGLPRYRFSPIHDFTGRVVPTWYAASTPQGAVAESLLHDIPIGRTGAYLTAGQFQGRLVSNLAPARRLRLVRLDHDGLRVLGRRPADVTETEADRYISTARVAQLLYDTTDVDGLAWVSRRRNIDCVVMLFGDRVAARDLPVAGTVHDFDTMGGSTWLYDYVTTLGIQLAPPVI